MKIWQPRERGAVHFFQTSPVGLNPNQSGDTYGGLRESWELYEYLVLFRMADDLAKQLGDDWSWNVISSPELTLLRNAPTTGIVYLENENGRIELRTQQRFMPMKEGQKEGQFASLSNQRDPDYLIGYFDPDGKLKSWIVLDAKFRTAQGGVHEGMGKIHIYRDSLRWNGQPPVAGYAIIPKTVSRTERYTTDEYRTTHNFGLLICPLAPEPDWLSPVMYWLENITENKQ